MPSGKTIEVGEGTSLLSALLGAEIGILHKCEGQAKCGSCHIFVQEGRKGLSKVAREENEKLSQRVAALEAVGGLQAQLRARAVSQVVTVDPSEKQTASGLKEIRFSRVRPRVKFVCGTLADVSESSGRDPVEDFHVILTELASFSEELAAKPMFVIASKIDVAQDPDRIASVRTLARERVELPAGETGGLFFRMNSNTDRRKALSAALRWDVGTFLTGNQNSPRLQVTIRDGGRVAVDTTWNYSSVVLPEGSFRTNLGNMRVTYNFSTTMFVQSLVQYNDRTRRWSTNLRFHWLETAGTGLFVVYNDTESIDGFGPVNRAFIVKYVRQFDILR
jgi:ferredoxin